MVKARYHLVGIGGVGMSPLAQVLAEEARKGYDIKVQGSDRSFDQGQRPEFFKKLQNLGVKLVPQDGSGVKQWHSLVVSTAIEDSNPDLMAAKSKGVPILHRSDLLAEFLHRGQGVAITGTSGKSSVTAMLGHILAANWKDPLVVGGAAMLNFRGKLHTGHARYGEGPVVIEADESDGTVVSYHPDIAVITSLSFDHKPIADVRAMFKTFVGQTKKTVILPVSLAETFKKHTKAKVVTFGLDGGDYRAAGIRQVGGTLKFRVGLTPFELPTVGKFQALNAIAATAAAHELGLNKAKCATALKTYEGVERRFQVLGKNSAGAVVVDDYAHNPEKLEAAIAGARLLGKPIALIFQPHGFGPTRLLKDHLKAVFGKKLKKEDALFLLPIYYAGGTVQRDISSEDLLPETGPGTRQVLADFQAVAEAVGQWQQAGAVVLVTGARDPNLGKLAELLIQI